MPFRRGARIELVGEETAIREVAKLRVRVRFTPDRVFLVPGRPLADLAWSEIRYDAYSYLVWE